MIEFVQNDGGRIEAGFKGKAGDCVCRAIAIVTGLPYREVYDRLAAGNASQRVTKHTKKKLAGKKTARSGIYTHRKWFKDYMAELGFEWVATMQIGSGCQVHLNAAELPKGRIIVSLSKHYAAVIDGVLHDTYDCSDRGTTTYYLNHPKDLLPKKAYLHESGDRYVYKPERCVYGYWKLNR